MSACHSLPLIVYPLSYCTMQEALMLDSLEEAQQLCGMHGYGTAMHAGVPVVLLLKVCACC